MTDEVVALKCHLRFLEDFVKLLEQSSWMNMLGCTSSAEDRIQSGSLRHGLANFNHFIPLYAETMGNKFARVSLEAIRVFTS